MGKMAENGSKAKEYKRRCKELSEVNMEKRVAGRGGEGREGEEVQWKDIVEVALETALR